MGLDTLYRPLRFEDVVGQETTVSLLRSVIRDGSGFRQSYVFAGAYGSGKTTLARILARALLCLNPQEGDPCDHCESCELFLSGGNHDSFVEVDAANHSGKADISQIREDVMYSSFSGRRKIYLFDEAHQLSSQAMDALLLLLEEPITPEGDKRLVCIFCTTELDRMREAILSRCAPAFRVQTPPPERVRDRLAFVASKEGITFDPDALLMVAEATECHLRSSLKALETVSKSGPVTLESVRDKLGLRSTQLATEVLRLIVMTSDASLIEAGQSFAKEHGAAVAYEKTTEAALLAYQLSVGIPIGGNLWPTGVLSQIGKVGGTFLIDIAEHLSGRPSRSTATGFLCDLLHLSQLKRGPSQHLGRTLPSISKDSSPSTGSVRTEITPYTTATGVFVNPAARRSKQESSKDLSPQEFAIELKRLIAERNGQSGRNNMGHT